jgi:DNA-binding MarR family transcriptional regulator
MAANTAKADEPMGFGDQGGLVGFQLLELYDAYVRRLQHETASRLMALNLTQWRTLTLIRFNPDRTQRALSKAVGIDPSSMTPIIDGFEKHDWVRRHASNENRSAYKIRLTPEGLAAYDQIKQEMARLDEGFAESLGETERQTLARTLERLRIDLAEPLG